MRVLFADAIDPSTVDVLTERGHECVSDPKLSADDLPARIPGFQGLVVRSTEVTAATIEAADALELIVRDRSNTLQSPGLLTLSLKSTIPPEFWDLQCPDFTISCHCLIFAISQNDNKRCRNFPINTFAASLATLPVL